MGLVGRDLLVRWAHAPDGTPIPAGLLAALGIALSAAPLSTMLATMLTIIVVLGSV